MITSLHSILFFNMPHFAGICFALNFTPKPKHPGSGAIYDFIVVSGNPWRCTPVKFTACDVCAREKNNLLARGMDKRGGAVSIHQRRV